MDYNIELDRACNRFRSCKDCHWSKQLPCNYTRWRRALLHFQLSTWTAAWKIPVVQSKRNLCVSSLHMERQEHYVPVARDLLTKQLANDVSAVLASNQT